LETKKRQLQEISDYISKLPERKTKQQRAWLEQQQAELRRESKVASKANTVDEDDYISDERKRDDNSNIEKTLEKIPEEV